MNVTNFHLGEENRITRRATSLPIRHQSIVQIVIHQSSQPSLGQIWRKVNQRSRYKVQEIYSGVRAYGTERADIRVISGRLDTQQMSIRTREQPSVVGSIASFRLQASFRRVCNHCVVVVTDNQCCEFT